ncbi:MAG: lytic transglycosylase domain-containing protein [Anaerolineae bacterium]|nr:lytic transglycosylase domain-containing protein [Anaerolineae bacterium]
MAQYTPYFDNYIDVESPLLPGTYRAAGVPNWQRLGIILLFIAIVVPLFITIKPEPVVMPPVAAEPVAVAEVALAEPAQAGDVAAGAGISPLFAAPVQHWAPLIVEWAGRTGVDPNMAATIMQVESCGDPQAISSAGAQGLFQVMPFHFAPGEDSLDPATNARRGLTYFAERIEQTGGDIGRAFAGYNGGQRAAASSWDQWHPETQRYYVWTTGIYDEIQQGLDESPTLQRWLQAGGASLCNQAAGRLGLPSS